MAEGQQMSGFVSNAFAKGMSKTELRSLLLKGGWPKGMVDDYLGRVVPVEPTVRSIVLQCKAIQKKSANRAILENISLEIGKGELFGIVGLGSSGKSTLMQILAGVIQPDGGDVQIIENNVTRSICRDEAARALLGFSPQVPSMYGDLTVRENLLHFAALYGMAEAAQKNAAATLVRTLKMDKEADVLAAALSSGQRKRLDLACALIHNPRVLLLDDPASELDAFQQRELWALLQDLTQKGTTVVIASDFASDLEMVCTRMGILRNGRITEVGKPDDLRVIYSHDFEIRLRTARAAYAQIISTLSADASSAIKKMTKDGSTLLLQTPTPQAALRSVLIAIDKADDTIISVDVMRPTIQEVFEALSSR